MVGQKGEIKSTSSCVVCAAKVATTAEHVPPKSYFEPPYPENLITVPACGPCNNGSQKDDDYFLAYLVSRDVVGGTPSLDAVRKRVTRGLHRPKFPGLRNRLLASAQWTTQIDPATGRHQLVFVTRAESDRLARTLQKQVRGILYHVTSESIPKSRFMMIERVWGMQTRPPKFWEMWTGAADYALRGTSGVVGDVFKYSVRQVRRSACAYVVRLEFYGVFPYVALVFHPDFGPPQRVALPF